MKSDYEGDGFGRSCHSNQKESAKSDSADLPIQIIIDSNKNSLHLVYHNYNRYQQ